MTRSATSSDVAAALELSAATVQRYAREGRIPFSTTPGGHRRFDIDEVRNALGLQREQDDARRTAKAVVLTALPTEFDAVMEHLQDPRVSRFPHGTRYYEATFRGNQIDWLVAVAEIGEGNVAAATEATRAIDTLNPDILLFVGVAGSLKSDVEHGQVVVASKVYRYHSGKAAEDFLARPVTFPTWHGLDQLVRMVRSSAWTASDPKPRVELKPIAAGDQVVTSKSSETFALLERHCNDAVAVDMESAGVYEAAHRSNGVAALAVRGISDMLEDKTATGDRTWQPQASRNAAEFAFALLKSADPEDLQLRPAVPAYADELADLLSQVPPPTAAAWRRSRLNGSLKLRLLRRMVADAPPTSEAAELAVSEAQDLGDADLLIAAGEYALAYELNSIGADAFEAAVSLGAEGPTRWLARAALALGAAGEPEKASRVLANARKLTDETARDDAFVDVVDAGLAEDAARVEVATRGIAADDPLAALMRMRALALLGRRSEAVELGESFLHDRPGASYTGGIALEVARLLIDQVQTGGSVRLPANAARRARVLALDVRDLRRRWKGQSGEAAALAARAAAAEGDFALALRIAAPPPHGELDEAEQTNPDVATIAGNAALAVGEFATARILAQSVEDEAEKLLIEADCARGEARESQEIVAILRRAEAVVGDEHQRFRVLMGLADEGVKDLSGLDEIDRVDAAAAAVVRSRVALAEGDIKSAVRELRSFNTPLAASFLTEAYLEGGQIDEAVETLRRSAEVHSRPQNLTRAVTLLAQAGRYEEALEEATKAMLQVPQDSALHKDLRRTCIELAARMGDWVSTVSHARAALGEGERDSDLHWALIGGLYNQREFESALSAYRASGIVARDEQEAQLAIALLRTEGTDEDSVRDVLELADRFSGSEIVVASAFGAVLELTRNLEIQPDTAARIQQMTSGYFDLFPDGGRITRIDVSKIDNLVDHLRDQFASDSELFGPMLRDALLCRIPFGLPVLLRGKSIAGTLITLGLGCVPVGPANPAIAEAERTAARAAMDSKVVADTHSLFVAGHTGLPPRDLLARFTRVLVAPETLDDILDAVGTLRMRSTGSLGWNPEENRPVLTEVSEDVAEAWANEAEELLTTVRRCQVTQRTALAGGDEANAILAPLSLAVQHGLPLWSDDPFIRQVARNEGVSAFSTVALLEVLKEEAAIDGHQFDDALMTMLRDCLVDLPLRPDLVLRAEAEDDPPTNASLLPITRPSAWNTPQVALEVFKKAIAEHAMTNHDRVRSWSMAAGVGAARSVLPHLRQGALATLVLSGFTSAESDPHVMPELLAGVRSAAEDAGVDDPLPVVVAMLRDSLLGDEVPAEVSARAFTFVVSHLSDTDRNLALREFLRGD